MIPRIPQTADREIRFTETFDQEFLSFQLAAPVKGPVRLPLMLLLKVGGPPAKDFLDPCRWVRPLTS
jgi:hypothetical protein